MAATNARVLELSDADRQALESWLVEFDRSWEEGRLAGRTTQLSALPEALRFSADFRMIIYGVILVVAMFVMPSGVAGWLRERELNRMREQLR